MKDIRWPTFLGIGAPKAGTTWLFRCLQAHPAIFMAAVKETNFFDYATIDGRLHEYTAHFAGSTGYAAVGEISTRYLASYRAPARIKAYLPEGRLLAVVRNPLEQVYSHYWHLRRQNFHQWDRRRVPDSFEAALDTYAEKLLEPAYYGKHLQRWQRDFAPAQLLILFYDDICARPHEVLRTLYTFLGVAATFVPPALHQQDAAVRRGTSPRSPLLGRVHSALYDILHRSLYARCKQLLGTRAAARLKEALRVRPLMEALFMQPGYPEMHPQTRQRLGGHFAADIAHLARLTGRDLRHWQ